VLLDRLLAQGIGSLKNAGELGGGNNGRHRAGGQESASPPPGPSLVA